jgi:hypothetical protein
VTAMNGEHCADSVVLGDSAYQVVEGFVGEVLASASPPGERPAMQPSPRALAELDPLSELVARLQPG